MAPKISVVMSTYNCNRKHLNETVQSIIDQTFKNFEFVIIDDHSTAYKVKDILSNINDSRIRVYRNSINMGLTKSLNIGVKATKSNVIARIDAGDIAEKERLKIQYKFLQDNIMYSFVGSDAKIIDDSGKIIRVKKRLHTYKGVCFYAYINNPFMHSAVMFYKNCFYDVGGYDSYFKYAQDYDLWCRFLIKYQGINLQKSLVRWRDSSQGISRKHTSEQINYADRIVVNYFRKTLPELNNIPDSMLLMVRHNRYNRNSIGVSDRIVRAMYEKYICKYSNEWYSSYLNRTKCFR